MRPKGPQTAGKRRMNLLLTKRDQERLQRLAEATNATSDTEIIREALLVYEEIVRRLMRGHVIYTKKGHDAAVELNVLIDVEAQKENFVHESPPTTLGQRSIRPLREQPVSRP